MSRISPRTRDVLEVIVGYGLILIVIWTPNPLQRILYWITVAAVLSPHSAAPRKPEDTGPWKERSGHFHSGSPCVAFALSALAVWVAFRLHTLHSLFGQAPLFSHVWGYVVWALMQQFLLQSYFLSRLLRLVPRPLAGGRDRGVAIRPRPHPQSGTYSSYAGLGSLFLSVFVRYRNLYTLGLAHGILGICLAITIPDHVHRHMRVGLGYLHYHQRMATMKSQRSSAPQTVSTVACVIADAAIRRSARQARP